MIKCTFNSVTEIIDVGKRNREHIIIDDTPHWKVIRCHVAWPCRPSNGTSTANPFEECFIQQGTYSQNPMRGRPSYWLTTFLFAKVREWLSPPTAPGTAHYSQCHRRSGVNNPPEPNPSPTCYAKSGIFSSCVAIACELSVAQWLVHKVSPINNPIQLEWRLIGRTRHCSWKNSDPFHAK